MLTIDVRFYGELRRFAEDPRPDGVSRREISLDQDTTVHSLIEALGISPEELGHIFLNNRLLFTRATMNLWLDYPDAKERVPASGTLWDTALCAGDRVALFGQDMGLLVV